MGAEGARAVDILKRAAKRCQRGYFARRPKPQSVFLLGLAPVLFFASLSSTLAGIPGMLYAVLGLGLIILIHEFGHFAAAKICDVYVEAFAIGFGPALISKKVGETDYRLNILPLGGYVKMLGQDDMDSTQMTSEEVAENPRSYSAKSVPRRMLIISAGVIMNMITAVMFYMATFGFGINRLEPTAGFVQPGRPGWTAGLRPGDRFTEMDGRPVLRFMDIFRGTALSSGPISIKGVTADGTEFQKTIAPEIKDGDETRMIGVGPSESTTLAPFAGEPPVRPGTEAARKFTKAVPLNTTVTSLNGQPVDSYIGMLDMLAEYRAEPLTVTTSNNDEFTLDPVPFRDYGIQLHIGKITGIQNGSIAAAENIKPGDRLDKVDGLAVGTEIDPMRLPDYFSDRAGTPVAVRVLRESSSGQPEEIDLSITPANRRAWETPPIPLDSPLTIPSLGVTCDIIPRVSFVVEGSPAAEAGIEAGDTLLQANLVPSAEIVEASPDAETQQIELGDEGSWPAVFWRAQYSPGIDLALTYSDAESEDVITVDLESADATDWYVPNARGLVFSNAMFKQNATDFGNAFSLAIEETGSKVTEIYLTLKALFTGNVGVKGLRGPIGILGIAKQIADRGPADFLDFLGYISVNLAVLNFLPIPVLDGGHMVLLAYEAIFRKKPSERVVMALTQVGLLLLLTLFVTCTFFDIDRIIKSVFG